MAEIIILLFFAIQILYPDKVSSTSTPSYTIVKILDEFKTSGLESVQIDQKINRPLFSVEGITICIDSDNIQAFEYPDNATALIDFETLIQKYSVKPIKSPSKNDIHFFIIDNVIVFYMGSNTNILSVLNSLRDA